MSSSSRNFSTKAVGVGVLALVLGLTSCATGSEPGATPSRSSAPSARSGSSAQAGTSTGGTAQLWVKRYDSGSDFPDWVGGVAASPDGTRVFVSGSSATVGYRADTGKRLWVAKTDVFSRTGGSTPPPTVAVSPDGGTVFVAGTSSIFAYSATDGQQLWRKRFGTSGTDGDARSVGVRPTGGTVFVHGMLPGTASGSDFLTIAYRTSNGARAWVSRYDGPAGADEMLWPGGAGALDVDATGRTVFVTGGSAGDGSATDYATVAYRARTGAVRWVSRYDGPAGSDDLAGAVAVSRDGRTVVTTGFSSGGATNSDYATVGYDAATGKQLWASRYNGPAGQNEGAGSVVVDPGGAAVFVTGTSEGADVGREDYATVAYDLGTGKQLWVRRYNGPANRDDNAAALGIGARGSTVYVTGRSVNTESGEADFATVAYRATSGERVWTKRYDSPDPGRDEAVALAVSVRSSRVFVAGNSSDDYATVAYRG